MPPSKYINSIAHINLTVPPQTLHLADIFYAETLGLEKVKVPRGQEETLAWYDLTPGGQQIHIAFPSSSPSSSSSDSNELSFSSARRHPCFHIPTPDLLLELQERIYAHYLEGGGQGQAGEKNVGGTGDGERKKSAPREADKPGERNSG